MNAVLKLATYQDVLDLPEHLTGEILYGSLHTQPRPALPHARSAGRLYGHIDREFDADDGGGPGGWWILIEPELHLDAHVLVPDIAGWRRSRLPRLPAEAHLTLAPDWICEVLSPGTVRTDRGTKMRIYAEQGVSHAWLLDPIARTLEAFELVNGRWQLLDVHGGTDVVRVPPFDAIELDLSHLWLDLS